MRILITGSRWQRDFEPIRDVLAPYLSRQNTFVHGACPTGVDAIADDLLRSWGLGEQIEDYPAEDFGLWPACGPKRNSYMVSLGADICLAFPCPESRGTRDCMRKAKAAGIPVTTVNVKGRASNAPAAGGRS